MKSGRLTGPLAPVMASEASKRPILFGTLSAISKLAPRDGIELLGVTCHFDSSDIFHAKPTGLLGRAVGAKIISGLERVVNNKGWPIERRNDQLIFTMYQPAIPSALAMKVIASRVIHQNTGHPRPATATLQITARCQADCYHCSAARHRYKFRPELTTDQWKSVLRQIEDVGIVNIVFTGGEPLLRPDIYELISFVRKDESNAMMFTNGMLLTEENVKKLVDAGLFSLNVSIDSPDPKAHDELRKVHRCFERATEGARRAREAGLIVGISTYATPERLRTGQIMEMIRLAKDVGAHEITIFDVVPTGRLLLEDAQHLLTDEDKDELMRIEEEWNARREHPHVITQAHVNGPKGAGCYAGWFQFYMTAYGDMMPCDFTPLTVGNSLQEPVDALWKRLANHRVYAEHCNHCRMQDADFRARYIDPIPDSGPFPFPIAELDRLTSADAESGLRAA
jgi:MoaA/NifB/PqqE/SkfB family radical SAM enzyme